MRIQIPAFIFVFVIGFGHLLYGQQDLVWESLYQQAGEMVLNGEYKAGIKVAEKVLSLAERKFGAQDPRAAQSLNLLAHYYYQLGDLKRAEAHAKRAIELEPDDISTLNNLA